MTETAAQLSLLPIEPPVPLFEGLFSVSELLEHADLRWFDHNGELVIKIVPKTFTESVRHFGILHPILLTQDMDPEGVITYHVAAGRGRLQAALTLNLDCIPVRMFSARAIDPETLTLIENTHRADNIAAEFDAIQAILKDFVVRGQPVSEKDLCDALGLNPQSLKKRMTLSRLIPPLLDGLRGGQMPQSVAENAAKLDLIYQKQLAQTLKEKGKLTSRDVHDARSTQTRTAELKLPDEIFGTPPAPFQTQEVEPITEVYVVVAMTTEKASDAVGFDFSIYAAGLNRETAQRCADEMNGRGGGYTYRVEACPVLQ